MIQLYNTALARSTNFPYSSVSPSRTQPGPPRHAISWIGVADRICRMTIRFTLHRLFKKLISSANTIGAVIKERKILTCASPVRPENAYSKSCNKRKRKYWVLQRKYTFKFEITPDRKENLYWKKTKLFRFRWNWDKEEKNARHPSVDFLLQSPVGGGGKDFVDMLFWWRGFRQMRWLILWILYLDK